MPCMIIKAGIEASRFAPEPYTDGFKEAFYGGYICGSLTPTFLYRATIRMEIRGGGGMQPGDTATFGYCQRYFEISYSCVCIVSQDLFVR